MSVPQVNFPSSLATPVSQIPTPSQRNVYPSQNTSVLEKIKTISQTTPLFPLEKASTQQMTTTKVGLDSTVQLLEDSSVGELEKKGQIYLSLTTKRNVFDFCELSLLQAIQDKNKKGGTSSLDRMKESIRSALEINPEEVFKYFSNLNIKNEAFKTQASSFASKATPQTVQEAQRIMSLAMNFESLVKQFEGVMTSLCYTQGIDLPDTDDS